MAAQRPTPDPGGTGCLVQVDHLVERIRLGTEADD
jgi:hypothetical protein